MSASGTPGRELPPGTFRIDREGVWRHEGQEVTHPGVLGNLYANLRVDSEGHYLQVGPARIPVEVADAPFVVVRVEAESIRGDSPQSLRVHLSDTTAEALSPETISMSPGGVPYCRVKAGRFRARFSVAAWLELARFIEEAPGAPAALVVGGRRYAVGWGARAEGA